MKFPLLIILLVLIVSELHSQNKTASDNERIYSIETDSVFNIQLHDAFKIIYRNIEYEQAAGFMPFGPDMKTRWDNVGSKKKIFSKGNKVLVVNFQNDYFICREDTTGKTDLWFKLSELKSIKDSISEYNDLPIWENNNIKYISVYDYFLNLFEKGKTKLLVKKYFRADINIRFENSFHSVHYQLGFGGDNSLRWRNSCLDEMLGSGLPHVMLVKTKDGRLLYDRKIQGKFSEYGNHNPDSVVSLHAAFESIKYNSDGTVGKPLMPEFYAANFVASQQGNKITIDSEMPLSIGPAFLEYEAFKNNKTKYFVPFYASSTLCYNFYSSHYNKSIPVIFKQYGYSESIITNYLNGNYQNMICLKYSIQNLNFSKHPNTENLRNLLGKILFDATKENRIYSFEDAQMNIPAYIQGMKWPKDYVELLKKDSLSSRDISEFVKNINDIAIVKYWYRTHPNEFRNTCFVYGIAPVMYNNETGKTEPIAFYLLKAIEDIFTGNDLRDFKNFIIKNSLQEEKTVAVNSGGFLKFGNQVFCPLNLPDNLKKDTSLAIVFERCVNVEKDTIPVYIKSIVSKNGNLPNYKLCDSIFVPYIKHISSGIELYTGEGGCGFYNKATGELQPLPYDVTFPYSNGIAVVMNLPGLTKSWKYGFVDLSGKEIVPVIYDGAFAFNENRAIVKTNNKWTFINRTGKEVVASKYDSLLDFNDGIAAYRLNGLWGIIDTTGKELTANIYDSLMPFSDGLCLVCKKGFSGFINKNGEQVIPCNYSKAESFSCGLACVQNVNDWGFINVKGKIKIPLTDYDGYKKFTEGLAPVRKKGSDFWCYIDKKGKEKISNEFLDADNFYEGLAAVKLQVKTNEYKWGYIDKTGTIIVPAAFNETSGFSDDRAIVKLANNEYAYIDKTGKLLSDKTWQKLFPVDGKFGFAGFNDYEDIVVIDRNGNELPYYAYLRCGAYYNYNKLPEKDCIRFKNNFIRIDVPPNIGEFGEDNYIHYMDKNGVLY